MAPTDTYTEQAHALLRAAFDAFDHHDDATLSEADLTWEAALVVIGRLLPVAAAARAVREGVLARGDVTAGIGALVVAVEDFDRHNP